ncbi:MAG: hypothetical protein K1X81_01725 [Bacteroidia bacterium]|nr:hypothetical protein [Bacteroidia bacterium]
MKTTIKLFLSILLLGGIGCSKDTTTEKQSFDLDMVIIVDRTDSLRVHPTAGSVMRLTGLKENRWTGVRIYVSYISNVDMTVDREICLPRENPVLGNPQKRDAQAQHMLIDLALAMKLGDTITDHSIVYRTMARGLNRLSKSTSPKKLMLVYSDLMKHSSLNFYDTATRNLLDTHPAQVATIFEQSLPLEKLNDIEIRFIYSPASYKANASYMQVAKFFEYLFESKGAHVELQAPFGFN